MKKMVVLSGLQKFKAPNQQLAFVCVTANTNAEKQKADTDTNDDNVQAPSKKKKTLAVSNQLTGDTAEHVPAQEGPTDEGYFFVHSSIHQITYIIH
jgi:hypothetical protein